MTTIIDAKDMLLGRLASIVAKRALAGEEVIIINAEKAVISGTYDSLVEKYEHRMKRGDIYKGPFFPRMPDRLVRRTIRGMLPWHKAKGRAAFKKIKVYIGKPVEIEKIKAAALDLKKEASSTRLKDQKFVRVEEISKALGAKW